jgi:predicted RNase H-like HicB family nuclease
MQVSFLIQREMTKTIRRYGVIIYWSNEDQVFVAEVPELPGCMAHGETKAEARANADEAVRLWLDTAVGFGDPVPEPRVQRLMLT